MPVIGILGNPLVPGPNEPGPPGPGESAVGYYAFLCVYNEKNVPAPGRMRPERSHTATLETDSFAIQAQELSHGRSHVATLETRSDVLSLQELCYGEKPRSYPRNEGGRRFRDERVQTRRHSTP